MLLDLKELANLLAQDPIVTYKLRHQIFHSPWGKDGRLWHDRDAVMLLDYGLHMYGREEVLDKFLSQLETGREYHIFGVSTGLLPLLEQHFDSIQREENCTAYTMSPEDFQGGERLPSLSIDDAEFVDEHWTYKHEGSAEFFKEIIRSYPSSAIRIDGQLAGWSVCYDATDDMVNLGSLRVLDQYKRRGLGHKLAVDLVQKVLELGKTPMVHIVDNNIASKTLSLGIGFKPHSEKIFWGKGKKK